MTRIAAQRGLAAVVLVIAAAGLMFLLRPWTSATSPQPGEPRTVTPAQGVPAVVTVPMLSDDAYSAEAAEFSIEDLCIYEELLEQEAKAESSALEPDEVVGDFEALKDNIKARLVVSENPEHLHVAAILERDPAKRVELISRAVAAGKDNVLHLWGAVEFCEQAPSEVDCPLQAWQDRLLSLDSQNGEAWIRAAVTRFAAGDKGAALYAMRRAASASESRIYWPDTIDMVGRALAAASDLSLPERQTYAFTFSALPIRSYQAEMLMCEEGAAGPLAREWAEACLAYGELSERESKNVLAQSIALAMQRQALESLGEKQRAAAVWKKYQNEYQRRVDAAEDSQRYELVLATNPTIFHRYIDAIREYGETQARVSMRKEVDQWVRRHQSLECIP